MATSPSSASPQPSAVRVIDIPANVPTTVRFLGGVSGLIVHWNGKRSLPCPGPADCLPAVHRLRSVWRGYAPGECWDSNRQLWIPGVIPITSALEEQLRARTLRGEVWVLSRMQDSKKQVPVQGLYCERQSEDVLSACFDILPVLQRFYSVPTLVLGVLNPTPAKVLLEPAAGPAPNLPAGLQPPAEAPPTPEEIARFREGLRNRWKQTGQPADARPARNGGA